MKCRMDSTHYLLDKEKAARKTDSFYNGKLTGIFGEGVWESNSPRTLYAPNTGFEDQEAHQVPIHLQSERVK